MWAKDEMRLTQANERAQTLLAHLASGYATDPAQLETSLIALGQLDLMDEATGVLVPLRAQAAALRSAMVQVIEGIDDQALDASAQTIATLAPDLVLLDDAERREIEAQIGHALAVRDRIDFCLRGARTLLGESLVVPEALQVALASWDDIVRPELWRLIPLNPLREQETSWVCPSKRAQRWWWHRGCTLPDETLRHLGQVAQLIVEIPQAGDELERLIAVERDLRGAGAAADLRNVISLAEVLRRRARDSLNAPTAIASRGGSLTAPSSPAIRYWEFGHLDGLAQGVVAVAAAEYRPVVVHAHEAFVLSVTEEALVVDYEPAIQPLETRPPVLTVRGLPPLAAEAVLPGRYQFLLAAAHFHQAEAELIIPHQLGEFQVKLPF